VTGVAIGPTGAPEAAVCPRHAALQ